LRRVIPVSQNSARHLEHISKKLRIGHRAQHPVKAATMSDPLTDAINTATTQPQSMSNDGVAVTNRSLADQIAAKKFLDANSNVLGIAQGQLGFPAVKICPPGAGGGHHDDYY
jgi:hypothetical protein